MSSLHKIRPFRLTGLTFAASLATIATAQIPVVPTVFPSTSWTTATPAELYIDPAALAAALAATSGHFGSYGTSQMMILRKGRVLWQGPDVATRVNIYSSTKSFTSTILGTLVDQGVLGVNSLANDYEPLLTTHYPNLTFRHFTTMTSGYDSVNTPAGIDMYGYASEDRSATPYLPKAPLFPVGTKSCYWEENMLMFGRVLTNIVNLPAVNPSCTPRTLKTYLDQKVLGPLGVPASDWKWDTLGQNAGNIPINHGGAFLHLPATHLARFGHLLLNRGNWNGSQVVSSSWIDQATSLQVPYSLPYYPTAKDSVSGVYGYNFWLKGTDPDPDSNLLAGTSAPAGTFFTWGYHNNLCFVIPEWDMVIVRTSGRPDSTQEETVNYDADYVGWKAFFNTLAPGVYHSGLRATYCNFPDSDLAVARPPSRRTNETTRIEAQINFDWGSGSPAPTVASDNFYSEWNGYYRPTTGGAAYFYGARNDHLLVEIDLNGDGVFQPSETVLGTWSSLGASVIGPSPAVTLTAGKFYKIRVRALERYGNAQAILYRRATAGTPTTGDVIPATDFCHP